MYEFDAIGTHWWLERLDGGKLTSAIKEDIANYTAEFDRRYSRFRDDSLVAALARTGELTNPPEEMRAMLKKADEFSKATGGAFSLLVGDDLVRLGYGPSLPQTALPFQGSTLENDNGLRVEEDRIRTKVGTVLDFGGLGKGWLIDEYAEILRKHGARQFIVNGGGDIYVQSEAPVEFALENPYDSSKMLGTVHLQRGALAASSTVKRSWNNSGGKQHHIIDPVTGKPSKSDVVASFVTAQTALVADVLATVLIIRPELDEQLRAYYHVQTKLIKLYKKQLSNSFLVDL